MGALVFGGLVLCLVVVLGFMTYGAFLGLAILGRLVKRVWSQVMAFDRKGEAIATGGLGDDGEAGERCWQIKGCSATARKLCPAYYRPNLPCWLANMEASEPCRLKPECMACSLFSVPALMTHA